MLTADGYKKAKDIVIGDTLATLDFDDITYGADNCSFGDVTAECSEIVNSWSVNELKNHKLLNSKITNILTESHNKTMVINDDQDKRFSLKEDVLIYKNNKYVIVTVENLSVGDSLVIYSDESINIVPITSLNIIKEKTNTILFYREPYGMIIAGGMLAYNGCPIHMLTN